MKLDLEPAKGVLRDFLKKLSVIKDVRRGMSAPLFTTSSEIPPTELLSTFHTPPNVVDSYWEKDDAYTWLYGTPRYHRHMCRMGTKRPIPPFYSQPVQPLFDKWLELYLDVQSIPSYHIPKPSSGETVHAYLQRLQSIVVNEGERRKIWWLSLRSFTDFLRDETRRQIESLGELDVIFPEDMTIYFDGIIRKVPITLYPIDIWAAAEIIQNLANLVFDSRPNAQLSAAQALGLAWVCLASGHAQFMTRLEFLHELHPSSPKELKQDDPFKPNHYLTTRTFFGKIDAPISKMLHDYLLALPKTNPHYIFDQPLRTLRRALDRAISISKQAQDLGKITFLTLMHQSHEGRGHRFKGYGNRLEKTP